MMDFMLDDQVLSGAGFGGVFVYLLAYALLQAGVVRGSSYFYAGMNIAAASLVLVGLTVDFNPSAALIQVSFIAISLFGMARLAIDSRSIRFTEEERRLLDDAFPDMPPRLARRLLNAGAWLEMQRGERLTEQGAPVRTLFWISSGEALVNAGGALVRMGPGGLVGEMRVLTAGPATATVELIAPSRLFLIPGATLQRMTRRDADFRIALETGMTRDIGRKLVEANARLAAAR
ncbi:cyclic nucleotide-binding domain-containing protein [Albimonas sp. CAU 1670]|uniref:Crp/Fnr family transcriptional regulator n=1 Tax=Albimonas sp. CAU 1670 TaxID=3032599 RepID=UPI0023DA380C|nr:cyclic nucleotide-binding domain-containing protein [Albimonas sp. CAU 1670]MDF2231549.1 cyclic nucleotide-binding domain-containing protein [Albimonas sp. CAU 1670]